MKPLIFLFTILSVAIGACTKTDSIDPIPSSLDGKWRMITVTENASGLTITKPSSIQGDVEITITPITSTIGTFIGNTPSNNISQNSYSTGANQSLTIPVLSMTKVMETSWGNEFVENIRNSQEYSFEIGGRLIIQTTNKILTFKKN